MLLYNIVYFICVYIQVVYFICRKCSGLKYNIYLINLYI